MEKQKERVGQTRITSVSVSKEFNELIERYNLSPTEIFRKGIAVSLYDLGVEDYRTPLNEKRIKYSEDFFRLLERSEKMSNFFDRLLKVAEGIKEMEEKWKTNIY